MNLDLWAETFNFCYACVAGAQTIVNTTNNPYMPIYLPTYNNRIRVSSNCVKLIFVKVHLSTLGASRDAVFLLDSSRFFSIGR